MKRSIKTSFFGIALAVYASAMPAIAGEKIGILFGSFGDIDNPKTELRDLVRNTLTDPDILPLHPLVRHGIADVGWIMDRSGLMEEYAAIGGKSGMRQRAQNQADAVAKILSERGLDVTAYTGFTMTFPFVREALDQARADGIERLIVYYQGAQYSKVTGQILFRHVREYMAKHPNWNVEIVGIRSFSDDERFFNLLKTRLDKSLTAFENVNSEDVCIFLPMHGQVQRVVNEGDPYYDEVMRLVAKIKSEYGAHRVSYGFQNHDEIPFIKWTMPNTDNALASLAKQSCPAVTINGLISFTVDSLETLYDHAISEPETLKGEAKKFGKGEPQIKVEPMFNSDQDFVEFMADLAEEALAGQGNLENLNR